jgi:hypothetical protein
MQRMLAGETKTRNLSEFADKSLRQNAVRHVGRRTRHDRPIGTN